MIRNKWWSNLTKGTQQCADAGDNTGFYEALKSVYGPAHHVQSPLRSADGQVLLTDGAYIQSRWSEHFQALFRADRVVQDSAILRIPQLPVKVKLDEPSSMEELTEAIKRLEVAKQQELTGSAH